MTSDKNQSTFKKREGYLNISKIGILMLKLLAMSDLHLGFDHPAKLFTFEIPEEIDLVLMAGDIADGSKPQYLEWILNATAGKPVIVTLGNHELYGSSRDKIITEFRAAFEGTHVQFLLNESIVINDIRFAVTDLWTDFWLNGDAALAMNFAESVMNDFSQVRIKSGEHYRKLRPIDTVKWHNEAKLFIEQILNTSQEPVVLMTHHGVSRKGIASQYQNSPLNPAFASDLEPLFESAKAPPILSVFGHTHSHICDYLDCGTLIYCNARGYVEHELVKGFNPNQMITINDDAIVSVADS